MLFKDQNNWAGALMHFLLADGLNRMATNDLAMGVRRVSE